MNSSKINISNSFLIVCIILLCVTIVSCGSSKDTSLINNTNEQSINDNIKPDTVVTEIQVDKALLRRDSLTKVYKEELFDEAQSKANRITTFYILAQQKFYNQEYQEALFLINQAARVKETADVLALKGSIYLGLGSTENFLTFWRRALELDKDLPLPPSPAIVQELKRYGLIDKNTDNR